MSEFIQFVFALIVTFSIIVTVHELGHYMAARFFGVHVLRFSLGFGAPFYSKSLRKAKPPMPSTHNEPEFPPTEFVLSAIPLGGYVKFLDDREQKVPSEFSSACFNHKGPWQRIAIAAAGPIANFLLAIICYWSIFIAGEGVGYSPVLGGIDSESIAAKSGLKQNQEIVRVDFKETRTWRDVRIQLLNRMGETGEIVFTVREKDNIALSQYRIPVTNFLSKSDDPNPISALGLILSTPAQSAKIGGLSVDGRAKASGLRIGDQIRKVDKEPIHTWQEFVSIIQANPETSLSLEIDRNGLSKTLTLVPKLKSDDMPIGFIGASPTIIDWPQERLVSRKYSMGEAFLKAIEQTLAFINFTLNSLRKMLQGDISVKNLSGPLHVGEIANDTLEAGVLSFISFIALLSISLGVINLLPIPMLDGGHICYYIIEVFRGKPLPDNVQNFAAQIGIFILLGIMMLAMYNDIQRFLG